MVREHQKTLAVASDFEGAGENRRQTEPLSFSASTKLLPEEILMPKAPHSPTTRRHGRFAERYWRSRLDTGNGYIDRHGHDAAVGRQVKQFFGVAPAAGL